MLTLEMRARHQATSLPTIPAETVKHHQHRQQRCEARYIALTTYPAVYHSRLWHGVSDDGTPYTQEFGSYKDHPLYQAEYFRQLKIVRARRFA